MTCRQQEKMGYDQDVWAHRESGSILNFVSVFLQVGKGPMVPIPRHFVTLADDSGLSFISRWTAALLSSPPWTQLFSTI